MENKEIEEKIARLQPVPGGDKVLATLWLKKALSEDKIDILSFLKRGRRISPLTVLLKETSVIYDTTGASRVARNILKSFDIMERVISLCLTCNNKC